MNLSKPRILVDSYIITIQLQTGLSYETNAHYSFCFCLDVSPEASKLYIYELGCLDILSEQTVIFRLTNDLRLFILVFSCDNDV